MELWPMQQKLIKDTKQAWSQGKPYIIQAGQRSGKTTLLIELLHSESYAIIVTSIQSQAYEIEHYASIHKVKHLNVFTCSQFDHAIKNPVSQAIYNTYDYAIGFDEAFYMNNGEWLFKEACKYCSKVVAIGNKNNNKIWDTTANVSLATWEVNPNVKESDEYFKNMKQNDFTRFMQDFAG